MLRHMYVIRDIVAKESGPIFEAVNDGVALRRFQQMCAETEGLQIGDYELYHVGMIEHDDDVVTPTPPRRVVAAVDQDPNDSDLDYTVEQAR